MKRFDDRIQGTIGLSPTHGTSRGTSRPRNSGRTQLVPLFEYRKKKRTHLKQSNVSHESQLS